MDIPQKTTNVQAQHILLLVLVLGALGLFLLNTRLPEGAHEPCAENMAKLWEGEYPEPVVHVQTDIVRDGFTDMCLTAMQTCRISKGLYHPWAKKDLRYATHKEKEFYESMRNFQSDIQSYSKGTQVIVEARLSPDTCMLRVEKDRWKGDCPSSQAFRLVSGTPYQKGRQFVEVPCQEGYSTWIEIHDALFEEDAVSRGMIQGYGLVTTQ